VNALLGISESATLALWGVAMLVTCILFRRPKRTDTPVHVGNLEVRSLNS
jgi:hypothetical protein